MTKYIFSQVAGSLLAFNADTDELYFGFGSAADLSIVISDNNLILTLGDVSVTLLEVSYGLLNTSNVTFADGSQFLFDQNTTAAEPVTGVNNAPLALADSASASENGAAVLIDVLANDTDADAGDSKTVLSIDGAGTPDTVIIIINQGVGAPVLFRGIPALKGTASVTEDGSQILYSPNGAFESLRAGQTATDTFAYTMTDSAGGQSTARVTVTVTGENDAPVAVHDSFSIAKGGAPTTVDVLKNDTDVDLGDTKRIVAVDTDGLLGTATVAANGSRIVYSAGNAFQHLIPGETAIETFTYTMVDGFGAQSTAAVTVTITGDNTAPRAVADRALATEDRAAVFIDVLANDTDGDTDDSKTVLSVNSPALKGAVSVAPDGTGLIYSVGNAFQNLRAGARTTETFSYTMADGAGAQSTANVTVTVTGVNDAPVALADSRIVSEDAAPLSIAVLHNDTDVDVGDTKKVVSIDSTGLQGTATIAANGLGVVYSVGDAFQHLTTGQIATDTFRYTIQDGLGAQSTAAVTITVTGITDGPKAIADTAVAAEDNGPITINVLANDINDLNPGAAQPVVSVDGAGLPATLELTLVRGVGVGIINPGLPALLGTVAVAPDGQAVVYTPFQSLRAGEVGTDYFRYTITDGTGLQSTAVASITVTGANDGPVAADDSASVAQDAGTVLIDVLANDTDPDAGDIKKVLSVDATGLQGTVAVDGDGSAIVYTVANAFQNLPFGQTATETFDYTMVDGFGAQSTATVTVTVTGANDAPIAVADSAAATEDGAPVVIDVLANDQDINLPAGDVLTVVRINEAGLLGTVSTDGSSILYSTGNWFQSVGANQTTFDFFSYTIADTLGLESTADVTVTVTGVNDAPVATADIMPISEDTVSVLINVLANDSDVDAGDSMRISSVAGAGLLGTVAVSPDGLSLIYSPGSAFQNLEAGEVGTETFSYTVADDAGAQSSASVTVTLAGAPDSVVSVNSPPPTPDAIIGTANDDVINGTAGADIIYGQGGDDDIVAGEGTDTIFGGAGDDGIEGGAGNDIIVGGAGTDDLQGGSGADIFRFYLSSDSIPLDFDRIGDFRSSQGDTIDLNLIDASTIEAGNNDFVMSESFTGVAGQLVLSAVGNLWTVLGDVNGDTLADLQIEVSAVGGPLTSADFLL